VVRSPTQRRTDPQQQEVYPLDYSKKKFNKNRSLLPTEEISTPDPAPATKPTTQNDHAQIVSEGPSTQEMFTAIMATLKAYDKRLETVEADRAAEKIRAESTHAQKQPAETGNTNCNREEGNQEEPDNPEESDDSEDSSSSGSSATAFSNSEDEHTRDEREEGDEPPSPQPPQQLYPLPEDALLIENCSGFYWNKHKFTSRDVLVLRESTTAAHWVFSLQPEARMSDQLFELLSAAKNISSYPVSHTQTFLKAFKFLDGKISEASQWSSPNPKTFSISTEKLGLSEDLEKLANDILCQRKSTNRQATKLNLDSIPNEEYEKEAQLRQTAWSACKVAEALETTLQSLNVIPKMSALHSIQDRDLKIQQIAEFVAYAKKLATEHALTLTKKALNQKAAIRYDALKKLQPPLIKEKLLKSDLLQPSLFGEEEFRAADVMASQTVHFAERPRQQSREWRPQAQKRPYQEYDNAQRKKSRPNNPAPPSRDPRTQHSSPPRHHSSNTQQQPKTQTQRKTSNDRPSHQGQQGHQNQQGHRGQQGQQNHQPQQARSQFSWQRNNNPPNPFRKSSF